VLPHALHSPPETFCTLQLPSLTNNLRPVKTERQYTDINKASISTCIKLQLSSEISWSTHTRTHAHTMFLSLSLSLSDSLCSLYVLYMFCISFSSSVTVWPGRAGCSWHRQDKL
jgi:hypothetical protein